MTLHITYDHPCPQCGAEYIPYDADVPCPNCGLVEAERFDYIRDLLGSAIFNRRRYGSYVPPVWWSGSLGDDIAFHVFCILERHPVRDNMGSFRPAARAAVEAVNWGKHPYTKDHVYQIACRVYEEMEKLPPEPTKYEDPLKWRRTHHTGVIETARDHLLGKRFAQRRGEYGE